jgi:hypothetical protein
MTVRTSQQGIKRITHDHFALERQEDTDGNTVGFSLQFLDDKSGFSAGHLLKLIVSFGGTWETYDIGKLSEVRALTNIDLENRTSEAIKARLVLVDRKSKFQNFSAGSEEIEFKSKKDRKGSEKIGILDVSLDDELANQLWTLRISFNDGPRIFLNSAPELQAMEMMNSNRAFQGAILPTVYKEILEYLVRDADVRDTDWGLTWKNYFMSSGFSEFEEAKELKEDEPHEYELLIEKTVRAFCSKHQFVDAMIAEIENDQGA